MHRIDRVLMNTKTLFITWQWKSWKLEKIDELERKQVFTDQVYKFSNGYRKYEAGVWYRLCDTIAEAELEQRPSIHQIPEESPEVCK
jgi:hypothetical protein